MTTSIIVHLQWDRSVGLLQTGQQGSIKELINLSGNAFAYFQMMYGYQWFNINLAS